MWRVILLDTNAPEAENFHLQRVALISVPAAQGKSGVLTISGGGRPILF